MGKMLSFHALSRRDGQVLGLLIGLLSPWNQARSECIGPPELEQQVQASPTVEAYTKLGTWFGEHGQYECATPAFQKALHGDPESAKLNYFLGLSLFSSGHAQDALPVLRQSIQIDPKAVQPRILLGSLLAASGAKAEAEEQWKAALQVDPQSAAALDAYANELMDNADPSAAITLLRGVKRDEDLDLDLARAYGLAGMLDESQATVQGALKVDPQSLRLTKALATVYVHQHRYQDASSLLEKYLQQDPSNTEAEIEYLRALVLNNDTITAVPLATKLRGSVPHNFDVLYLSGILERKAGDYAAARGHLQEAITMNPDDYSSRFNLGAALAHLGDSAGAKLNLEKAVALDPSQTEAHFQLAGVLRQLGESSAAQEQLAIYQKLSSAHVALSESQTKAEQAAQKLSAGDAQQAVSLYRDAVAATPDNALLQYKLAMTLDQAGDIPAERASLQRAVELDPTLAIAHNQLGYLASRSGESARAAEEFQLAVKAAPAFTEGWINLAAILAQQSRFAEAQQAIATALRLDPDNKQAQELNQQLGVAAHR